MISVSTEKNKLNIPFIQHFLKDVYWAAGRTIDEVCLFHRLRRQGHLSGAAPLHRGAGQGARP